MNDKNLRTKTLEEIEGVKWGEPEYPSYLVKTIHKLRKKPIKDFTVEDLRINIGQSLGLEYLIPIAIEVLEKNILAEGDFYEGDLLKSVLHSNEEFWRENPRLWNKVIKILEDNKGIIESMDTTKEIRDGLNQNIKRFQNLKR